MFKYAIAILAFTGITAQAAAPVTSEYFYQPEAEKSVVEPQFTFSSATLKYDDGTKDDTSGSMLMLEYQRGINEMVSAGMTASYTSATAESGGTETELSGLGDVGLFTKARTAFWEGSSLHYGATLFLSPGDRSFTSDNVDAQTGGHFISPYVGYQWILGSNVLGVSVETELFLGDKTWEMNGNTIDVSGGENSALTAFYEMPVDAALYGVSLAYTATGALEANNSTISDGLNSIELSGYGTWDVSETATVVGRVSYGQIMQDELNSAELDSNSAMGVNVGGRFAF